MAEIPASEVKALVSRYREVSRGLARDFVARVTIEDARVAALTRDAVRMLDSLDSTTEAWARRNLVKAYRAQRRETDEMLKESGLSRKGSCRVAKRDVVDRQSLNAIATDPAVGFLSSLKAATDEVRLRLRLIKNQARALSAQRRTIDEAIESSGILRNTALGSAKRSVVSELASSKKAADLVWKPRAASLGQRHIFANLANLPYVTSGGKSMRLDRYAELVIGIKTRQATTIAQRNTLMEHCQGLISISRNSSKDNDACNLYVGRIFALTTEAAEEFGVPHVDQLPGGGAPFHPNCTHFEVPVFPEIMRESVLNRAVTPPPKWALGRSWSEVQREYVARGGNVYGRRQNPNIKGVTRRGSRNQKAMSARQRRRTALQARRRVG